MKNLLAKFLCTIAPITLAGCMTKPLPPTYEIAGQDKLDTLVPTCQVESLDSPPQTVQFINDPRKADNDQYDDELLRLDRATAQHGETKGQPIVYYDGRVMGYLSTIFARWQMNRGCALHQADAMEMPEILSGIRSHAPIFGQVVEMRGAIERRFYKSIDCQALEQTFADTGMASDPEGRKIILDAVKSDLGTFIDHFDHYPNYSKSWRLDALEQCAAKQPASPPEREADSTRRRSLCLSCNPAQLGLNL